MYEKDVSSGFPHSVSFLILRLHFILGAPSSVVGREVEWRRLEPEVTDDNVIIIPSPDDYQYETIDLRAWESSGYCYVDRVRETADEWVLDLLVNESIHGRYITIVFRDDGNGDLTLTIYRYRTGDKPKIINMKEEAGL